MNRYRFAILIAIIFALPGLSREIVVDPAGPVRTVRSALNAATPGDTVRVRPGIYREGPLTIATPLTLLGEGWPVLDGEKKHQVLTVTADDVTITGMTIARSGVSFMEDQAGIKVEEAARVVIADNRLDSNFFAIYLAKSSNSVVRGNRIRSDAATEASSGNGVHLWYCRDIDVYDNDVRGHRDGIYFEFVTGGDIHDNHSEGNLRYGLHFMFSDSCRYRGNTFTDNGAGVAVMYTRNVEMSGNRFLDNWGSAAFGLLLKEISDSRISGNVFRNNSIALYAENSNRVAVTHNDFLENGWGVKIMANCMDNRFSANNFIGNAFDVATNSRNNFSTFSGNYWSGYGGYDLDHDGSGDVPFRPVRLFSVLVESNPPTLILLRSLFVDLLDVAERVFPILTPETLIDGRPAMRRISHD